MIKPIVRVSVSEQVFQQMKQMIIDREWIPGSKLPSESELRCMFDVSRVTVRNALHRLSALGLIETKLGDGSYVRQIDADGTSLNNLIPVAYLEEDIFSILEFRREVESGTCALAAQKATQEDLAELKHMLERMEAAKNDLDLLPLIDLEFHYKIARISRNNLIIKTYEIVSEIYTAHIKSTVKSMGGEMGSYWHKKIVDAIEYHDVQKAREYMFEHISKNVEFFENNGPTI